MKLSIIQSDVYYKQKDNNIDQLERAIARLDTVGDLVLLPELFSTGYIFESPDDIHKLCEDFTNSPTIHALSKIANKYDTLIVAGIAEKDNGQFYNSVAVIDEHGLKYKYRKISQTNIDKQYFSRGDQLTTFKHKGLSFGIAICFDLWFPEIIREYATMGVDVLLHPANFGSDQSLKISTARAIENNMYVATCNRIGKEITTEIVGEYCGKSQVCEPSGNLLIKFDSSVSVATVSIDSDVELPKKVIGVALINEMQNIKKNLK